MSSDDDGDSDSDDASILNSNRHNSNSNRSNPYSAVSEINATSKNGEKWTEGEVQRLRDMKGRGMTDK